MLEPLRLRQSLNFTTLISNAANPASTGTMRLATGDTIVWRNNANSGDITLSKTAADNLLFSSGIVATAAMGAQFFTTNTANTAASGAIRLASSESVAWRNNANSADLLLSKSTTDILTWASGLQVAFFQSPTVNPAGTGQIRLAKTDAISWRNNANSADLPLAINGSDQITFNSLPLLTSAILTFKSEYQNNTAVTISNSATEQTLMTFTLPANELSGTQYLEIFGSGNVVDGSGTISAVLKIYLDGNVIVSNLSGTIGLGNTIGWKATARYGLVTGGAGGTIECYADLTDTANTTNQTNAGNVPASSMAVATTTFAFDTTATHVIKITTTMSSANAANTTTQRMMHINRIG